MDSINQRVLVTGATGHLGAAVVEELIRTGAKHVIAASRSPAKLDALRERGVETRLADFDRADTLRDAFAGVDRVAVISTAALDVPGQRLKQHRAAVAAAGSCGVKHVVYTSAPAPYPTAENSLNDDHFWTEAALFAGPFTWTVLRNQLYMELVLRSAGHALQSGKLFSATRGGARAYVSRDDCARAVAGALLRADRSEIYDITGPAALTQSEVAAALSETGGKPVEHVDVSPEEYADHLSHGGLPPELVRAIVDFDIAAAEGYHALVTPAVERLTGRPPVTLRAFLDGHLRGSGR